MAIIAGQKTCRWSLCLETLTAVRQALVAPDGISFGSTIAACGKVRWWTKAMELLEEMSRKQLEVDRRRWWKSDNFLYTQIDIYIYIYMYYIIYIYHIYIYIRIYWYAAGLWSNLAAPSKMQDDQHVRHENS